MKDRNLCQRVWDRFKEDMKCERCGNSDRRVLVFHHRDPSTKKFSPRYGEGHRRSLAAIFQEMDKCDILCANCHFIAHWEMQEVQREFREAQERKWREAWARR